VSYPWAFRTGLCPAGRPRQYLGHNPLGRITVSLLLLLLLTQAVMGLVLAGTDLFYPPIGAWIADRIAALLINGAGYIFWHMFPVL